jgi:DNA-binding CsgD family transcriptional regulator
LLQMENMTTSALSIESVDGRRLPDGLAIRPLPMVRSRAACEVGAAIAHQLNEPVTALLFYVGFIQQNSDRFTDADGNNESLKQAADSACRVAELICSLIHRMSDLFEAPIPKETAVAVARDAIAWWSRVSELDGKSKDQAGDRKADDSSRPGTRPLTPREREVLQLVSEGNSNKEGAALMNISYRTFECHRAEVMRKLGVRNTAALVRLAMLNRMTSAPSPAQSARATLGKQNAG